MSRAAAPGSRRVLVGVGGDLGPVKVSADMIARIDRVRGLLTRSEWMRAAAAYTLTAVEDRRVSPSEVADWERRARLAEETLAEVRGALDRWKAVRP